MSDSQFPTDEEVAANVPDLPSVEDASPSQDESQELPDEWEYDGRKFSREEVEGVLENFGNWQEMQAAHTRRSQELAENRREADRIREEYEAKLAEIQAGRSNQPDYSDEPDVANQILEEMKQIHKRLDTQDKRYNDAMADVQKEDAWEKSLNPLRKYPLFDENQIRSTAESRGLGPESADLLYQALVGHRLGEMKGEASAASRYRVPVLGSTGPGGASLGMADTTPQVPISQTSWEDLENQAYEDPGVM